MKKAIISANIVLGVHAFLVIMHLLIIAGLLPAEIVWGGRMGEEMDGSQFLLLESVAISVLLLFSIPVYYKRRNLLTGQGEKSRIINIFLWAISIYYVLNTVGNLLSVTLFEQLMAIVTLCLSFLTGYLAMNRKIAVAKSDLG